MRVLYDTNVLMALTHRERIAVFKANLAARRFEHITSEYILAELERVLERKFGFTKQKARVTVRVFAKLSDVVEPTAIEKVSRDVFDDHVLAAAVEGRAEYIVTADQDLLVLGKHRGVAIIDPDDFNKLLGINSQFV